MIILFLTHTVGVRNKLFTKQLASFVDKHKTVHPDLCVFYSNLSEDVYQTTIIKATAPADQKTITTGRDELNNMINSLLNEKKQQLTVYLEANLGSIGGSEITERATQHAKALPFNRLVMFTETSCLQESCINKAADLGFRVDKALQTKNCMEDLNSSFNSLCEVPSDMSVDAFSLRQIEIENLTSLNSILPSTSSKLFEISVTSANSNSDSTRQPEASVRELKKYSNPAATKSYILPYLGRFFCCCNRGIKVGPRLGVSSISGSYSSLDKYGV